MSRICRICLCSIEECREKDKLLRTPFNSNFNIKIYDINNHGRYTIAVYNILGSYNPDDGEYYYPSRSYTALEHRKYDDTLLSLPLCVWEGLYDLFFQECLETVNKHNINRLPLPKSTRKKLRKFFTKKIHEYCESLSNLPKE